MIRLSEHLIPEPANCEMVSCKLHGVPSCRSSNKPRWRACFLSDSSNAPATVQRTTLRRVDTSTRANDTLWLKQ